MNTANTNEAREQPDEHSRAWPPSSPWHRFWRVWHRRVWPSLHTAGIRTQHHTQRAYAWARAQPRQRWGEIALGTALLALALLLITWGISSVIGWLAPAPPPPPPARPASHQPPHWLVAVNNVGLWHQIGNTLSGYAAQNASAAGMPAWMLLTSWTAIGGMLLLGSWFATKRFGIATLAWCVWLAATAWVLWTHTPGGSPVPAVLATALGVTAAAVPFSTPLIAAFVVLGIAPSIT